VPKEGYEGWSTDAILLKGAVDRGLSDIAHRFADAMLAGYYGCKLGTMRGYVVPTDNNVAYAEAHDTVFDPRKVSDLAEHVKGKFVGKVCWQNTRPTQFQLYEEWWQKLRNA
jgi:putative spermidine/putrescine transport system substrate-binding protein